MENKLIACIVEGAAERVIINKLLEHNKLIFSKENLLEQELLNCRSPRQFENRYLGKDFKSKISVYRILDSRSENFTLKKLYKDKVDVINVITAPEIEILIIINENKYANFSKVKSIMKPSDYCKQELKMKDVKSKDFVNSYFQDINILVDVLYKYKSLHKIHKNEKCLADLLR